MERAFGQAIDDDEERRVDRMLAEMTVEEKVGQIVGIPPLEDVDRAKRDVAAHHLGSCHFGGTPHATPAAKAEFANEVQRAAIEASRFDVPLFLRAMAEHGHAAVAGSTVFPQQLGLGATRDPELVRRCASVTATEMRATGVQSTSSPIGDVARDQRWGRIAETFGESPHLCAELTEAMVRGYQEGGDGVESADGPDGGEAGDAGGDAGDGSVDGDADDRVLAVTKHFPAYSDGRRGEDQAPNELSTYELRRVHLPAYRAGIEAGTGGIMPCYNAIDGEPVHGSARFLDDLLRDDLGFDGYVLADYRGAEDLHGGHGTSRSLEESLWQAIRAGIDLLPSGGADYAERIVSLVRDGELAEERIEESARRILRLKFALGLFDDPFVDPDDAAATLGSEDHRAVAREAARESMTLLENDGDLLPLDPDLDSVFVTGPNADDVAALHGGWGRVRDPRPLGDTVLDGIRETVSDDTDVAYEEVATVTEPVAVDAAAAAATDADVSVVVLGEPDYIHEFRDNESIRPEAFPNRERLTLPDAQLELAKAVHDAGTPTVVVFVTGRVLATPWIAEHVPAVLLAYQPGSAGTAVADVLFGETNPSGRLPISVPRSEGQIPQQFNHLTHPTIDNEAHLPSYDPLYEYGHGLSYATFEYEALELSDAEMAPEGTVTADVTVANVGDRRGTEPVELFVDDVHSSRVTPVRELVGFERVDLDAGERATVSFALGPEDLGVVGNDGARTVEPGEFEMFAGDLVEAFAVARRRPYDR